MFRVCRVCVCVCVCVCVLPERGQDSWEHETLSMSRCVFFFPRAAMKHVQPGLVHGRHETGRASCFNKMGAHSLFCSRDGYITGLRTAGQRCLSCSQSKRLNGMFGDKSSISPRHVNIFKRGNIMKAASGFCTFPKRM